MAFVLLFSIADGHAFIMSTYVQRSYLTHLCYLRFVETCSATGMRMRHKSLYTSRNLMASHGKSKCTIESLKASHVLWHNIKPIHHTFRPFTSIFGALRIGWGLVTRAIVSHRNSIWSILVHVGGHSVDWLKYFPILRQAMMKEETHHNLNVCCTKCINTEKGITRLWCKKKSYRDSNTG